MTRRAGLRKTRPRWPPRSIKRHREIGAEIRHPPDRCLPAGVQIHNRNLMRIRHIDEGATRRRVELKALGMSRERYATQERCLGWIDHGQAAAAITHHEIACACVEPDIVGVIAEIDARLRATGSVAVIQAHRSIAGARNRKHIGAGA